jgi:hypothetical protein
MQHPPRLVSVSGQWLFGRDGSSEKEGHGEGGLLYSAVWRVAK